ncbi:MAG: biotin--[acetyl-CoA-carboxylase] ligase [Chlamydiota bacterium]|nr:biotin--[acetyl-CoA-carboxylase] ligase [Chlamydiota bacterium]
MKDLPLKLTLEPYHFPSLNSTITWAKHHLSHFTSSKLVRISADEQTQGYGQYGRPWLTARGESVAITYGMILPPKCHLTVHRLHLLSVSALDWLKSRGLNVLLRWPNDLIVEGAKLGGLIGEQIVTPQGALLLCSLGINIHLSPSLAAQIDQPTTSLSHHIHNLPSPMEAIHAIDTRFLRALNKYAVAGFSPYYNAWKEALSPQPDESISLKHHETTYHGITRSIHPDGGLTLTLPSGEIKTFFSGSLVKHRSKNGELPPN